MQLNGWAFESRVYAEDPKRGFLPSTGRITHYQEPSGGPACWSIPASMRAAKCRMFYDPMIAKVCTHAQTREKAVDALQNALAAYVIQGVTTNMGFLQAILGNERFRRGDISTNFIEQEYPEGFSGAELTSENSRISSAPGCSLRCAAWNARRRFPTSSPAAPAPSARAGWFRSKGSISPSMSARVTYGYDISLDDEHISVRSSWQLGGQLFQGSIDGKPVSVHLRQKAEGLRLIYAGADGADQPLHPARGRTGAPHARNGEQPQRKRTRRPSSAGLILSVAVEDGEKVKAGQELLVIEAMKMENVIHAERDATIKQVLIAANESVQADQVLIEYME